jgi:hypothetical protein
MTADKPNGVSLVFDNKLITPTSGGEILTDVLDFVRRFVYLSDAQARLVSMWVAHTHAIGSSTTTPYLSINSAVKQSGKTRLLECLELLVARPWLTGRITAACLVRKVDQVRPTLLLDESDAAFGGDKEYAEALRGILNTGFYAGGVASCCVGQGTNITFKDFKTFCAKAIAGIGVLPDTVQDRSIPIRLQRKRPGETVARFRKRHAKHEAAAIKSDVSDWMQSIADQLKDAEPSLPDELSDRQQDGMEPLLAIADVAGGDWPEAVRRAAIEIFGSQAADDQNIGVQLLADIRTILQSLDDDKITSADLLAKLKEVETSPWADWSKGKGLSTNGLARLLKPFGISPKGTIRVEDRTAKGYSWDSFQDAFSRYLPSVTLKPDSQPSQASQPACLLTETRFSQPSQLPFVTLAKSASNPHEHCIVTDVTDGIPDTRQKRHVRTLPSCPVCHGYAIYQEPTGVMTCETCVARNAN